MTNELCGTKVDITQGFIKNQKHTKRKRKMFKHQLFQTVPCTDPAMDLRGNSGSYIWVDGNKVKLIVAKEGHSIASIRPITEFPGLVLPLGSFGGGNTGAGSTLTKISDKDIVGEYNDQQQNQGQRS